MGFSRGPNIVRDGLVLALDAGSPRSYPGSGTTWYDLSGNGNNGTLNSVTHSSANGGVFITAGSTASWIDIPSPNLTSTNYTILAASRYSGGSRGRMINGRSNNWLMGHWSETTENYYAGGWVSSVDVGASDTNWRIYQATGNISSDSYQQYVNSTLSAGPNSGGVSGPNGFGIGKYNPGNSEVTTGEIAFLFAYNRVLTTSEIQQNYNAFKSRFGL
jgi:hypothetical protein